MAVFTAFAFPASGEPTSRTLPDRLAEIFNVKDFGAVGDGVADDWAAIMAAYNHGRTTLTTTAPNSGNVLTFSSVPANIVGGGLYYASDLTTPASLSLVQVNAVTATTVTVAFVTGAIASGESIQFDLIDRGTIYFPPGTYKVSQPIDFSETAVGSHWLGNLGASQITGNFNDYVLKRALDGTDAQSGGHLVEKLAVTNTHATGGGIRLGQSVGAAIRNCTVTANICLNTANKDTKIAGAYWGSLEVSIENCVLSPGSNTSGSVGILTISDGPILNCRIIGFDAGLRVFGGQGAQVIMGCYFEGNGVAYQPAAPDGSSDGGANCILSGCWFKNNGTAILDPKGPVIMRGIRIEGAQASLPGGGNPQYGIRTSASSAMTFAEGKGIIVSGWFDIAGIKIAGGEDGNPQNTFVGVMSTNTSTTPGAVAWSLPSTAMSLRLIGCNVAPVYTMAQLPPKTLTVTNATWSSGTVTITFTGGNFTGKSGSATIFGISPSGFNGFFASSTFASFNTLTYPLVSNPGAYVSGGTVLVNILSDANELNAQEGDTYDVSDANSATWGANPVGGGSNHDCVRWSGQNWTVMGK